MRAGKSPLPFSAAGFPPHFVAKHGVWHYGMETSGLRRVVLREDCVIPFITCREER